MSSIWREGTPSFPPDYAKISIQASHVQGQHRLPSECTTHQHLNNHYLFGVEDRANGLDRQKEELLPRQQSDKPALSSPAEKTMWEKFSDKLSPFPPIHTKIKRGRDKDIETCKILFLELYNKSILLGLGFFQSGLLCRGDIWVHLHVPSRFWTWRHLRGVDKEAKAH